MKKSMSTLDQLIESYDVTEEQKRKLFSNVTIETFPIESDKTESELKIENDIQKEIEDDIEKSIDNENEKEVD